eukprot:scaffold8080_cov417-Prasinococcus_capsulatus_cf.AAC.10
MPVDVNGLKICCVGAGYVGGPTMAMIAKKAPMVKVTVVDLSQSRIDAWNSDDLPIYEYVVSRYLHNCARDRSYEYWGLVPAC